MARIRCNGCGKEVEAGPKECLHCGEPAIGPHHGWLALAKGYRRAAQALLDTPQSDPRTQYYLCGHAIEVALKSVLKRNGRSDNHLKKIGHNLHSALGKVSLLSEAQLLPAGLDDCVTMLNPYYKDHHFRYFTKTGVMTLPDLEQLMKAVTELINALDGEYRSGLFGHPRP